MLHCYFRSGVETPDFFLTKTQHIITMGSMDTKFHWLYNLARHTYSPWYVKTHHVSLVNKNNYDISEGPFLILSNHVGTHDPIEIGSVLLHRHIHWVAGAYMFKMPFVGWIMGKVCELIPKQQGRGDFETIRLISLGLCAQVSKTLRFVCALSFSCHCFVFRN